MSVHDDTMQGLKEALEYVKGDQAKGRSMTATISDELADTSQIILRKIANLSETDKQRAIQYIDELLQETV